MARPKLQKFTPEQIATINEMLEGLGEFVSIKGITVQPDGSLAFSGQHLKIDSDFLYYWAKDDTTGDEVFWRTGFTSVKSDFIQISGIPYTIFGTAKERAIFFMGRLETWVTVGDPYGGEQSQDAIQATLSFLPPVLTKGLHIYGVNLTRFSPDMPSFVFGTISLQDTKLVTLRYLPKGADTLIVPPTLESFEGVTSGIKTIEHVLPTLEANFMPLWWVKPQPDIQWTQESTKPSAHVAIFSKYWEDRSRPLAVRRVECGREMVARKLIKPRDVWAR